MTKKNRGDSFGGGDMDELDDGLSRKGLEKAEIYSADSQAKVANSGYF